MTARVVMLAAVLLLAAKGHGTKSKKHSAKPAASTTATPATTATAAPGSAPSPTPAAARLATTFADRVMITKTNGAFESGVVLATSAEALTLLEGNGVRAELPWKQIATLKRTAFGGDALAKKGDYVRVTRLDGTAVTGEVGAVTPATLDVASPEPKTATAIPWSDITTLAPTDRPEKKFTRWAWLNRIMNFCCSPLR